MTGRWRSTLQRLGSWARIIPSLIALRSRAKAARRRVTIMAAEFEHAAHNAQSATDELMRQMELSHAEYRR